MVEWLLFCVGIAIIIGAGTVSKYVAVRAKRGRPVEREHAERVEAHLAELERRLSDIQEVVLAIDEKLEQLEKGPKAQER